MCRFPNKAHQKIWMIMRLCILFVCVLQFSVFARGVAQDQVVSLEMQNVSYFELFNEIHQQTGLRFIYNTNQLEGMPAITVHADKQSVKEVLEGIFLNTPFTFSFEQNVVMVKMKPTNEDEKKALSVKGFVYDEKKQPLPGVTGGGNHGGYRHQRQRMVHHHITDIERETEILIRGVQRPGSGVLRKN